MAYIGKAPNTAIVNQATSQSFSGNGSTTFTLNRSVNRGEDLEVFVENVQQEPGEGKSYTASGTTLTFDAAPPNGTNNIYVIYRGEGTINPRLEHDANAALAATTGTFSGAVSGTTGTFTGDLTVDTSTLKVDSTNNRVGINTTGPTHPLHVVGDVQAENSSGHRALIVKGSSTTNYEGGSLLLANAGMDTNYGGTYLYHHKAGGSGTQNAAFNISQRTAGGAYVSNIWNVDYQNSVQSFYVPNGGISGAVAMGIDASGRVTMSNQPAFWFDQTNGANGVSNGTIAANTVIQFNGNRLNRGSHYSTSTNRFTAPIDGLYQFSFNTVFDNYSGNVVRVFEFAFVKNGATDFGFASACVPNFHSSNEHPTLNITDIQYLNANDYVEVRSRTHRDTSGGTFGIRNSRSCFSGYLVG